MPRVLQRSAHHDGLRYIAAQHLDLLIEALECARADVVASQDARWRQALLKDRDVLDLNR